MKCGVHVSVEMELVEERAPGWLINPDNANETGETTNNGGAPKKRFLRKYWKCPVVGCSRVAAFSTFERSNVLTFERSGAAA